MKRALAGLALVTALALSGCGATTANDEIVDDPATPIEQEPLPGDGGVDDDLDDMDEDGLDDGTDDSTGTDDGTGTDG